jgi:peptidyl-prolyl cis-trans isomerase C
MPGLEKLVLTLACGVLVVPALLSCGNRGGGKASQVIATVNGREITVSQLSRALETAGVREVTPETRKRALEALTAEELLVQAALEHEIDRDATFVQALEQSRRQLLAQFFAERKVYPKTLVTATEVNDYYEAEPLLFAQRRKFRLTTFRADASDVTRKVLGELDKADSVERVRGVLEAHGIKYVTELASVTPEQLPVGELDAYAQAKVGDVFVNPQSGGAVLLMTVTAIEDDVPMTLERARPLIEEYLRNLRNRKAAEAFLEHARAGATIVYTQPENAPAGTKLTRSADAGRAPLAASLAR